MAGKYGRTFKRKSAKKNYNKKTSAKKVVRKDRTKKLVKLIKGVQLSQCETMYRTRKIQSFSLNHNSIAVLALWEESTPVNESMFPTQGHTDGNRKGDEIITQGVRIRMVFNIPYDRRNTVIKLFFVPFNSSQGNPANPTELQHNMIGNIMLDPVQTDRWPGIKLLGTYYCRGKDLQGTDHHTIFVNRWMSMTKKVKFQDDGSVNPSNLKERGWLLLLPYSTTGALSTDTVATNCQASFTLYYKDP